MAAPERTTETGTCAELDGVPIVAPYRVGRRVIAYGGCGGPDEGDDRRESVGHYIIGPGGEVSMQAYRDIIGWPATPARTVGWEERAAYLAACRAVRARLLGVA